MYFRVSLLCILVIVSVEYATSKSGIEENNNNRIFSTTFDVIRPWDDNCELYTQMNYSHHLCDPELSNTEKVALESVRSIVYLIKLKIGSNKKEFKVILDTGSYKLWVFSEACKDEVANCKDHIKYKSSDSNTFEKVDDDFEIVYGKGSVKGMTVKDTVFLTSNMEVKKQLFGAVVEIDIKLKGIDGVLGLDVRKVGQELPLFLHAVKDELIEKPIYGIYLKPGGSAADGGEITFGGVNKGHLKEDTAVTSKVIGKSRRFYLQMEKLTFGENEMCKKEDATCFVHIDTGNSIIMGPKAIIEKLNKDEFKTDKDKKWEVDCSDVDDFPDLEVTFGDKTLKLESSFYIQKRKQKCYSGVRPKARFKENDPHWVFGDLFLHKYYTEYNLKEDKEEITFYVAK